MRHVLILIPCLNRGGTEMQTLYLVKSLVLLGCRVSVLCYFEYDDLVVDEYRMAGSSVVVMNLDRKLDAIAFIRTIRKAILDFKADVVHVQYMTPGALAVISARLSGVPRVYATVHQPFSSWHNLIWKYLLRFSSVLCDHFISVSLRTEKSWFGSVSSIENCKKKLPKHFTIHNAVDVSLVESIVQSEEALILKEKYAERDTFVFGFIGRLSYEKGLDILLMAFKELVARHKNIRLVVVGSGPEHSSLEDRYGGELWWADISFVGSLDWVGAITHLAVMDAVVVPSRFEGFGLSAVEAMAASRTVIASDCGGLSEVIEEMSSGLLFHNENVSDLRAKMELLYTQPSLMHSLSVGAKRRAMVFDVGRFHTQIHRLYSEAFYDW